MMISTKDNDLDCWNQAWRSGEGLQGCGDHLKTKPSKPKIWIFEILNWGIRRCYNRKIIGRSFFLPAAPEVRDV